MNIMKIIGALACLIVILSAQASIAKDKNYKFSVTGHVSEKITDKEDFALLKASEYATKKGYEFFVINKITRLEKKPKANQRLGARSSQKKRLSTRIEIHCFDAASGAEGEYNAQTLKQNIEVKYAE